MRKLHLAVGIAGVPDSAHLMFRSRHIYILAASLVNLVLGLYLRRHAQGWRRSFQAAGSALLMIAPALLILAFMVEPQYGLHPPIRWGAAGLYLLFGGSMAHLLCGAPA